VSKEVQFSFDTEEDRTDFILYAKGKGMSLSALAKYAIYQYRARYPLTAAERLGEKRKPGRPHKSILSVQSELSGASDGEKGIPHPKPESDSSLSARAQGNLNSKNKTKTLSTEATSPLFRRIYDGFLTWNEGVFSNYPKEATAVHALIKKARDRFGDDAEDGLASVCMAFRKLKEGDTSVRGFWRDQPYLPSALSPMWDRVLETMRTPVSDAGAMAVVTGGVV
jgi:hypothetical protein